MPCAPRERARKSYAHILGSQHRRKHLAIVARAVAQVVARPERRTRDAKRFDARRGSKESGAGAHDEKETAPYKMHVAPVALRGSGFLVVAARLRRSGGGFT